MGKKSASYSHGMNVAKSDLIVYKKVIYTKRRRDIWGSFDEHGHAILKLQIPKGTNFHFNQETPSDSDFGKCRAERVKVLGVSRSIKKSDECCLKYDPKKHTLRSGWDDTFTYNVGKSLKPDNFSPHGTCASGIHFFFTLQEALSYAV